MKRSSVGLVAPALAAIALLASCSGKRISDIDAPPSGAPSTGAAWSVPSGVVVRPAERGAANLAGLYPSTVPGDRRCCWLATDASIFVRAPRAPATLQIDVFVPEYPFFEAAPQTLEVRIGSQAATVETLAPGVHRLQFGGVTGDATDGLLRVRFHCKRAFVPAHENVNTDARSLGIILLGTSFH